VGGRLRGIAITSKARTPLLPDMPTIAESGFPNYQTTSWYGVLVKSGTPTMGGVLILIAIAVSTLLWFDLSNRFVWIVLIVTLGFGAIGWVDDWRKVVNKEWEEAINNSPWDHRSHVWAYCDVYAASVGDLVLPGQRHFYIPA